MKIKINSEKLSPEQIKELERIANSLEATEVNTIPTEVTENVNDMKLAITFMDMDIYNNNGLATSVPNKIYPTFAEAAILYNSGIEDIKNMNAVAAGTLINNTSVLIGSVVDNFLITILNLYESFVKSLNDYIDENVIKDFPTLKIWSDKELINREILEEGIANFFAGNIKERKYNIQESNNLIEYFISYSNIIGLNIYNDIRRQLNYAIVYNSINTEDIQKIYQALEILFSRFMCDMCYQSGVVHSNLVQIYDKVITKDNVPPVIYSNVKMLDN